MSIHRLVILQTMYGQKNFFSTFSYKLVQISPIMILVNSGAFLSISSWFCELTKLIFVMILLHFFYWLPPNNAKDYGYEQVANVLLLICRPCCISEDSESGQEISFGMVLY